MKIRHWALFVHLLARSGMSPGSRICVLLACSVACQAQETSATRVEVFWHHDRTLSIGEVTSVVIFDDSICSAEFIGNNLRLIGLARGKTAVFVWTGEHLQTLLVEVIEQPEKPQVPSLTKSGEGTVSVAVGTAMQSTSGEGQPGGYIFSQHLFLQQNIGEDRFTVQTQWQNALVPGDPSFNLSSGSIQYSTPGISLALLDSNVNLGGGNQARITPFPLATSIMLRGFDLQLRSGDQQIEAFGGITPTPYVLSLVGSRAIAGLTWTRMLNPRLILYSTTSATYVPKDSFQRGHGYTSSVFGLGGATFAVNQDLKLQGGTGLSNRGAIFEGAISFTEPHLTAFAGATYSSQNFPLNQLRLLPSGKASATAGLTSQMTSRVTASLLYQHTSTQPGAFIQSGSSSDYLNPNISFLITPNLHLTGNFTLTDTTGALSLASAVGRRGGLELSSRINPRLDYSIRSTFGSLSDPFQYNSQTSFSVSHSMNLRIRGKDTVSFNASYDRSNPSLLSRLMQDVYLLSPQLQTLFLQDPVTFVNSPNMPTDVRNLLISLQPTNAQVSVSGQFVIRDRVSIAPTVGYFRSTQNVEGGNNSQLFGVNLTAQVTASLQVISSLSNVITLDPATGSLRRQTVFGLGMNKTASTTPRWLALHAAKNGAIFGRVFQDLNVNGVSDPGEPAVDGTTVQINDELPVTTDSQGRFSFRNLRPGVYVVRLSLASIRGPFRVTTPVTATLDLTRQKSGQVNFGIVNFARIEGVLYNDYLLTGERQPDAPGIRDVHVVLIANGLKRETVSDSAGEFAFDRLKPGDYELTVESSSVPANFVASKSLKVHVAPAQISTQEFPIMALRSLAGHVFYKPKPDVLEQPLAGVQVSYGNVIASTNADGAFLLRNLPAGKLVLTLVPHRAFTNGLLPPSGTIELGRDPVEGQGIRIVVANPELVKCLVPDHQ